MTVPQSIAAAARARIRAARPQQTQVLEAVRDGQPLRAEPDPERLVRRLQAVTGVSRPQAESLADNQAPADLGLAGTRARGAERIQGDTTDFVSVAFLDMARAAARAVGRVVFRNLRAQGSGFLISDRLFLTNNHVVPSARDARGFLLEFDYELDIDGRPKVVTRFALDPDAFFLTSAEDDLDFTVVAVGQRHSGSGDPADFGHCPLLDSPDKHVLGEFVNLIQHPDGDDKQLVLRENRLVSRLDRVLHYLADTQPGSSGLPVFNDQWEAIALHLWGEPFTQTTTPDGRPIQREVNEGIRVSAIVKAARRVPPRRSPASDGFPQFHPVFP